MSHLTQFVPFQYFMIFYDFSTIYHILLCNNIFWTQISDLLYMEDTQIICRQSSKDSSNSVKIFYFFDNNREFLR